MPRKRTLCYRTSSAKRRKENRISRAEIHQAEPSTSSANDTPLDGSDVLNSGSRSHSCVLDHSDLTSAENATTSTSHSGIYQHDITHALESEADSDLDVSTFVLGVNEDLGQYQIQSLIVHGRKGRLQNPPFEPCMIEGLSLKCRHCNALFYPAEMKRGANMVGNQASFFPCCKKGLVELPPQRGVTANLQNLLTGIHPESANFRKYIRNYNGSLSFASMVANTCEFNTGGPYSYKVHGQVYHFTGCLEATEPNQEKFAQLYMIDSDLATRRRMEMNGNHLSEDLLKLLAEEISAINPFVESYQMMKRVVEEEDERHRDSQREILLFFDIERSNQRRFNLPVSNEIAAVFVSSDGQVPSGRAIVVKRNDNRIRRMPVTSPFVDPMTYPLIYPYGDLGWHCGMKMSNSKRLSMQSFYSHRIYYRENSWLHYTGKLFQQYVVDAFCKVEENRLDYIRNNQANLRIESYLGLTDYITNEAADRGVPVGRKVILPSSYTGSPRSMNQHYQDAMCLVSKFGKPDIFITFTCNPKWPEIRDALLPNQQVHDRPDIVSQVFKLRLNELCDDLFKKKIFGRCAANIGVIEFQKRGLPHAHILMTVADDDKIQSVQDIDDLVSAEIPDPVAEPMLHSYVVKHMIHGPCGDANPQCPCMVKDACSKRYPREFCEVTRQNVDGYPVYRRRNQFSGFAGRHEVNSQWVVPFNKFLLLRYNAHINVEICASIKSIKYLHKYIFKGHDAASLRLQSTSSGNSFLNYDEVETYMETRYVGASEATWRLCYFPLQFKSHQVIRLPVHCEMMQNIIFKPGEEDEAVANAAGNFTKLSAFFELNRQAADRPLDLSNMHDPRNHLYSEIPRFFVFSASNGWKPRKHFRNEIGRIHTVSPVDSERFHLRLLLLKRKGVTSFADLRTIDNRTHATFKSAAKALGLIKDDRQYENAIEEACLKQFPSQIRHFFSQILIFCNPSEPESLWNKFKLSMADDFIREGLDEAASLRKAYDDIRQIIDGRIDLSSLISAPPPIEGETFIQNSERSVEELNAIRNQGIDMYSKLNTEQLEVTEAILTAVQDTAAENRSFFLDGPAGSGKTFVYQTLNNILIGKGKKVINVAWSGIAAQLLLNGKTVHSVFKLPIPVNEDNFMSMINPFSEAAKKLLDADVFIWDEAPMCPKYAFHAVDEILRDLTGDARMFGGKMIIFGGDFRQIPPISKEKSASAVVEMSFKRSYIWPCLRKYALQRNMRADGEDASFLEYLRKIGDDAVPKTDEDEIIIPENLRCKSDLISEIFGRNVDALSKEELSSRAILCPKNCQCTEINEKVLNLLSGTTKVYYSVDDAICETGDEHYPMEFVNGLTPPGLPPHELKLKIGSMVMLLRNLDVNMGLCNGTRLVVSALNDHSIECHKVGSSRKFIIPRIDSSPCENDLPFKLQRHQFPIKLCFAMTINKSQGQTFAKIGVYLPTLPFSHGHLYVALSRCTKQENLKVQTKNGYSTKNVVIRELLY